LAGLKPALRRSAEVVKGGDHRQSAIDERAHRLAHVERGDGIEPGEGFIQYHQRLDTPRAPLPPPMGQGAGGDG
jgi:hypothetical protein